MHPIMLFEFRYIDFYYIHNDAADIIIPVRQLHPL